MSKRHKVYKTPWQKLPSSQFACVFDLETRGRIQDASGYTREQKIENLDISCLSLLCIDFDDASLSGDMGDELGEMKTYWAETTHMDEEETVEGGFAEVLEAFDKAQLIVGYNCISFDFKVLRKHYPPGSQLRYLEHLGKTHDIFDRVRKATGLWPKLDVLLGLNGLEQKSGDGLQAIKLFEDGKYKCLQNYCEDDVRLTAKLGLLRELCLPNTDVILEEKVFGIPSALEKAQLIHHQKYANTTPAEADEGNYSDTDGAEEEDEEPPQSDAAVPDQAKGAQTSAGSCSSES